MSKSSYAKSCPRTGLSFCMPQGIGTLEERDFLQIYHLEHYLFACVSPSFKQSGKLNAFDFFCIVVWKANRSKSKIARRLLSKGYANLESAIEALTTSIAKATSEKAKMKVLIVDWGFRLPMASAILSVLYPMMFTIYDIRVCDSLEAFHQVQNKTNFESLWEGYNSFVAAVKNQAPDKYTLRDKDRWLWGRSFCHQLKKDLKDMFYHAN